MKSVFKPFLILSFALLVTLGMSACQGETTTPTDLPTTGAQTTTTDSGPTTEGTGTTISSSSLTTNVITTTTTFNGVYVPVSIISIKGTGVSGGLLSIYQGNSVQFEALIAPSNATDKTPDWNSSNQSVATISESGQLTAVSPGQAVISATIDTKTAQVTVTVMPITEVESLAFSETGYEIYAQKFQSVTLSLASEVLFTPTNATYKDVLWSVTPVGEANPDHVSISATGEVSVVKEDAIQGSQYTITATSNSNPSVFTSVTLTIQHLLATSINIRWSHEPAPNLTNTYTFPISYSMYDGLNLAIETTPSGAMDNFVFTSNDPEVVSIETDDKFTYGSFQIEGIGTATISAISQANPLVSRTVTINVIDTPVGEEFVILDPLNPDFNLSLTASDISILEVDTRGYWNFDPEGATYATDRLASMMSWKNVRDYSTGPIIEMVNTGNGQAVFDGGYGMMFDSWDWPEDNEQTNLFAYNKIAIPDQDILKMRIRSQAIGGATGMAKFRVRLVDLETFESHFLLKDALTFQAETFNFPPDRPRADMGTQDPESYWITIDRVPDFSIGEDWFHFTIPSELQGTNMLMIFEVDDMHTPGVGTDGCDRVQFICAYFIDETNQDPNDLRTEG